MDEIKVTQSHSAFSLACGVRARIGAPAEKVWALLTNAQDFPRWNSTVTKIEGQIREGQTIKIHVPGTSRTFSPKISGVIPNAHMIWTGGFAPMFKGVRTFQLTSLDDGSTDFAMDETFSGLMLPLAKGSMPDFKPIFERYAGDLKSAAERGVTSTTR